MKMGVPKWLEKRSPELNVWLTVFVDNGNILMLFSFSDIWSWCIWSEKYSRHHISW